MKKIISTALLGVLVFNSSSITVLANGYDDISEAQENEIKDSEVKDSEVKDSEVKDSEGSDVDNNILIAEEVKGLKYIGNRTYDLSAEWMQGEYGEYPGIVPVDMTGILATTAIDFDQDGNNEILSASYEPSSVVGNENTIHLSVIKQDENGWNILTENEVVTQGQDGQYYNISCMDNTSSYQEESVFVRKYKESFEIYYENYGEGMFATGQNWIFRGFRFEDNVLSPIEETQNIAYEGSPITELWTSSYEDLGQYDMTYVEMLKAYCSLGFERPYISFDEMTVDQNDSLYEILRTRLDTNISQDSVMTWVNSRSGGSLEGFYFEIEDTGEEVSTDDLNEDEISKDNATIYDKVQNLLENTKHSSYPLLEYDDPVKLAAGFSNSPGGVLQAFIKTYGDISTKNNLWEQEYEEVLITLLARDTIFERIVEGWDEELSDIVAGYLEKVENEAISDFSVAAGKTINLSKGIFTDAVRNDIKHNVGSMLILAELAENTDDENLQKACQICMSNSFNATLRVVGDLLIDKAVDSGVDYLIAKQVVQNQILSTTLKKGVLNSIAQKFALGTAATWVTGILATKDVVSYISGINKRVDNYLKTVALSFIYDAGAKAYGKKIELICSGDTDAVSDAYILFQFILSAKQNAYEDMQGMFTLPIWKMIVSSDMYLKANIDSIQKITIDTYAKQTLESLTPKVKNGSIFLKVNATQKFICTGISYLSNIKYSSDNRKIAQVNSSGIIHAKKVGTTYIRCKVEQYGETYEVSCKVIVKNESKPDENDAFTAYRNLIEKYESEYGSASLNEQEQFWTGLCFAKLLDFNGDGVDELILAYQTEASNIDNVEYTVELWKFDGSSAERVASQISWTGNNMPYFGGFSISKYEEKYLLILTDNAGGDVSYYGTKDDGSIGLVHRLIWKGDIVQGDWYLDDEKISRETYEECYNKYRVDAIWYGFSEESCNETIKEEISQTRDKLKM